MTLLFRLGSFETSRSSQKLHCNGHNSRKWLRCRHRRPSHRPHRMEMVAHLLTTKLNEDLADKRRPFLGQVPLVLLCLSMAAWKLPSIRRSEDHSESRPVGDNYKIPETPRPKLDCLGLGLFSIAVSSLILVCQSMQEQYLSLSLTWIVVTVLIISSVSFILQEIFFAKNPLIPMRLLTTNGIGATFLLQILAMAAMFGVSVIRYLLRNDRSRLSQIVSIKRLGILCTNWIHVCQYRWTLPDACFVWIDGGCSVL